MSLFVLGIVTAAAGFVAIGFGIPVNAFSIGNTLIIAGTIAVVGGFIMIGLGTAVRELKRVAQSGALHPSAIANPAPTYADDHFDPHAQLSNSQAGLGFAPAPRSEPSPRAPLPSEQKVAMAPSTEPDPIEWLRPKNKEPTLGERAVIEEFEASLAPQPQSLPRPVAAPSMPKMPEPKLWIQNSPGEPATELSPAMRAELAARPAPSSERHPSGLFDSVWPDMRPVRSPETIERKRKPDALTPARDEIRAAKDVPRETPPPRLDEARPVAILKSGMIDGMAYTLFADGSIEAVLATGTIRFASVDALRDHLEKNG